MQRILLVEDEKAIAQMVKSHLESEGFAVITASDGEEALRVWAQEEPDLIVLDIMLPLLSGLDVLKTIRQQDEVPVIMLTARADEIDKLLGLELGADDYMSKPFSPRELTARIRAVLRRSGGKDRIANGLRELYIDLSRYQASLAGELLALTATEFRILALLAESPGQVFSRLQILERIYGDMYAGYERTIDTHINNLRRKMELIPDHHVVIKTVYGAGYKLVEEEHSA